MLPDQRFLNPSLTETVTAFDPQLPLTDIFTHNIIQPTGTELIDQGRKALIRFHAPTASSVIVHRGVSDGPVTTLEKQPDGDWTAILDSNGEKYATLFYEVDGVYILNPMAHIGWSHAHPINIVDFVQDDIDYYLAQDVPHGTVTRDYYHSNTCNCLKSCLVYTPPGYHTGQYQDLPVLYLQHGYGENETSWMHLGKVNWIMDNLLAEGKAVPCIIVMNNGMVQTLAPDGSRSWNPMTLERLLLDECIPYIDSHYRTNPDKSHRAMAGLSMGSMQTSFITLTHPEYFDYVGIFSGFLGMLAGITEVQNTHFAAFEDKAKLFSSYKLFFRSIGEADSFIAQYHNETALLKEKGLFDGGWTAYKETIYPGGHDWNVWRPSVRDFLSLTFR
jgi:enterochelin esterase-like enzyme